MLPVLWAAPVMRKLIYSTDISASDDLINEEVEFICSYLPAHRAEPTELCVCLLSSSGVEKPSTIFCHEIRKQGWIAGCLAKDVGLAVLALEVKHIHRKPDLLPPLVVLYRPCKLAIVVKEHVVRPRGIAIHALGKSLDAAVRD